MSPAAYYRWLHEQPFAWIGFRRLRPRPDQDFPFAVAAAIPLGFAGLFLLPLALLDGMLHASAGKGVPGVFYMILGVLGFVAGVVHGGFSWLTWNQRAVRQRAAGVVTSSPRPPWFIRWLIGPGYVLLISFVTPLALLITVENVRGALVWNRVRSDLQAKGEHLFIDEIVPPPVPADQNFASLPIFEDLFAYGRSGVPGQGMQWSNTNAMDRFREFYLPDNELPKSTRERTDHHPVTVHEWAEAFRALTTGMDPVMAKRYGLTPASANALAKSGRRWSQPDYPQAPSGADDATVVLTALSVGDQDMATICEASQRPYARFGVHWQDGFNTLLPHLAQMKSLTRNLDLRVAAKLEKGDMAGAFADARCAQRMSGVLREEPYLISQLVRFAQAAIAAQTVWRGIASHRWTDDQLLEFQRQFSKTDFLRAVAFALEGERSGSISVLERWATNSRRLREEIEGLGPTDSSDIPQGIAAGSAGSPMMPRGWIRQNQAALATLLQLRIDEARRLSTNPPAQGHAAGLLQFKATAGKESTLIGAPTSPYNVFVKLLLPALDKAMMKGVRADVTARLAATGCALERYRLKHGAYPDSLTALAPEFMPETPRDLMDNQPLRYAKTDDGLFRLWSVGQDGADNHGTARLPENKREEGEKGLDWVWPY